jgi:hypothetical protein
MGGDLFLPVISFDYLYIWIICDPMVHMDFT